MKANNHLEKGHVIVEATIIYPVVILVFIVIFYAAIFVFKKAGLQVNVENALLYYKSEMTDNYISMLNGFESDGEYRIGNAFEVPDSYKNPYRGENSLISYDRITGFVKQAYGLSDAEVTINQVKDFYLFKTIEATGNSSLDTAINVAMVGGKNHMEMTAGTIVTIADNDNMIRDIDFIAELTADAQFGQKLQEYKGKIIEKYNALMNNLENN